jgi:hypothetical protein
MSQRLSLWFRILTSECRKRHRLVFLKFVIESQRHNSRRSGRALSMGSSELLGWGGHGETREETAPFVAQAFLLAGSRDFPVPCSRARFTETWNWRLESRLYPPTRMSALRECLATVARGETRYGTPRVVAQAFLLAGSRDFPVPCSGHASPKHGTGDWKVAFTRRQECRRYGDTPDSGLSRLARSAKHCLASGNLNLISRKNTHKARERRILSLVGRQRRIAKAAEGWQAGRNLWTRGPSNSWRSGSARRW